LLREKWQGRAEAAERRVKEQASIIETRNKSLDDAEARVCGLTAQVEALNHLDEYRAKQSVTYAALCAALAERDDLRTRLAAIDAAKAGEPPMPDCGAKPTKDGFMVPQIRTQKIIVWGRQGWDAAAALRVDLAEKDKAMFDVGAQGKK
jgi:hypothetical protein